MEKFENFGSTVHSTREMNNFQIFGPTVDNYCEMGIYHFGPTVDNGHFHIFGHTVFISLLVLIWKNPDGAIK